MMYENDKLNIPEKYKKMSVSELRQEKLYIPISKSGIVIKKIPKTSIMFYL